jgi:hypothetical protein
MLLAAGRWPTGCPLLLPHMVMLGRCCATASRVLAPCLCRSCRAVCSLPPLQWPLHPLTHLLCNVFGRMLMSMRQGRLVPVTVMAIPLYRLVSPLVDASEPAQVGRFDSSTSRQATCLVLVHMCSHCHHQPEPPALICSCSLMCFPSFTPRTEPPSFPFSLTASSHFAANFFTSVDVGRSQLGAPSFP